MKKLILNLKHCYGIKSLAAEFDFAQQNVFAIYAANGAMKSSLASTFRDITDGKVSRDRVFPARECTRQVIDELGMAIGKESVLVVQPYDEMFGHTEKTSTLLVDQKLRTEYEQLHLAVDESKAVFLKALKEQTKSKKDIEKEISATFTKGDDQFYLALVRIKDELQAQKDAPFADVHYDTIFEEKVLGFLGTKDFKTAIEDYVKKYNELLASSTYFKRGVFNYYNAGTIAKSLADNGFFTAKHTVNLNADKKLEISTQKELEELIANERESISNDKDLKKKFAEIDKLITKNVTVRDFEAYITQHEEILPKLGNLGLFKEELWKSYIKARYETYKDLIEKYQIAQVRRAEIEAEAGKQRTQWEGVIDIFNSRFSVPFKLFAKNRVSVILGHKGVLSLGFTFEDGAEAASVERSDLMEVLSTGERKALYVLNIIFEIEARKKAKQDTIFIVDDIADSFDYKNKYAIIQYLMEIAEDPLFKLIILTHNFDFFRTINSRFVRYDHCLMAVKGGAGITLTKASGIQNVFVKDWKLQFFVDGRKRIASIPFIRNIIEYTRGEESPGFKKLTSLLHWKGDTAGITEGELDAIYNDVFGGAAASADGNKRVVDRIFDEGKGCLVAEGGINLEHKIVLSIAIRLSAERYMVDKLNDPAFVASIDSKQTSQLLTRFENKVKPDTKTLEIMQRVMLMTPENIHVNAFMYEPILDMSDEHLRKLFKEVLAL